MPDISTYEPIETITISSPTSTLTFNSIPATFTDLVLVYQVGANGSTSCNLGIRLNGDTGSNYSTTAMFGYYGSKGAGSYYLTHGYIGNLALGLIQTEVSANGHAIINSYSNTNTFKTIHSQFGQARDSTFAEVNATVNLWRNNAAVSSITVFSFSASYAANSTFSLYGIKAQ